MDRRSFLRNGAAIAAGAPGRAGRSAGFTVSDVRRPTTSEAFSARSAGDLAPYMPRPEKPWDARRAGHLLRRTGFGFAWSELDAALASTPSALVQVMLAPSAPPPAPAAWTTRPPLAGSDDANRVQYYSWIRDAQEWWVNLMLERTAMLREKMALFWHNHFVSEYPTVLVAQHMFRQNQLFREYAFGDFRKLVKEVTVDPAMLRYLDGATSRAGNPNENYARELLELFTLGAGSYADGTAHYTEHDIIELARALTGWNILGLDSEFMPPRFDNGAKTIFGATANFGVQGRAERDVIDLIFEQQDRDHSLPRAAVFLCSKLYRTFVYDVPDMAIVADMASTLVANGWRLAPVLEQLLTSEHFFDDAVIGAQIKSPADYVLGAIRGFGLQAPMDRTMTDVNRPETHDPVMAMSTLAQTLLSPPNVKGWPGGRYWISSATVPLRIRYAKLWLEPVPGALSYAFDPIAYVRSLPDADDAEKLLDHMIAHHLPFGASDDTRALLLDELLAGAPAYEWNPDAPNAGTRIRACLIRMTNLGEYQLM